MAEILFEIGCEELPASFIEPSLLQLQNEIAARLNAAGLDFEAQKPGGTPRRLVVSFINVPVIQPDQNVEQRGPSVTAAFDAEGRPSKALEGFCRGQGIEPKEVVQEGDYVWVRKVVPGKRTTEILQTVLPEALTALQFKKSMRWAGSKMRFARPIRWILASFDGSVVDFEVEGVRSGIQSYGHRFLSPTAFDATSLQELRSKLAENKVELSQQSRVERIAEGIREASADVMATQDLIEENANLTEWPEAHVGTFKPEFLELPVAVLKTVMAKHERFFPVGKEGKLTNSFVAVRNGGDPQVVSEGNAWVLNARFNDARFFFEEDKKRSLDQFLEMTAGMTFQEKLGTIRQRADRLSSLAREVALWSGANGDEATLAFTAGFYAKADLATGLVAELDELQGFIGGEYAKREGKPDEVCWAIASHYDLSHNPAPQCLGAMTAVRLLIADQLDKLAGFLGLGFVPTGSSDPYALRRAATMLIEAAWAWPTALTSYEPLFDHSLKQFEEQGFILDGAKARQAFGEVLGSRYENLLSESYDVVQAALLDEKSLLAPRGVRFRAKVMQQLSPNVNLINAATRPINIVESARKKGINVRGSADQDNLDSETGSALYSVIQAQAPLASQAAQNEDCDGLIQALTPLEEPINRFFDNTMVMVENTSVRDARLNLLEDCASVLRLAGDFSKLVIEG